MSTSEDIIERLERQFGMSFWDNPGSLGIDALAGAVGREMGVNPHGPRNDIAAGYLLLKGKEKKSSESLAALLAMGLHPILSTN